MKPVIGLGTSSCSSFFNWYIIHMHCCSTVLVRFYVTEVQHPTPTTPTFRRSNKGLAGCVVKGCGRKKLLSWWWSESRSENISRKEHTKACMHSLRSHLPDLSRHTKEYAFPNLLTFLNLMKLTYQDRSTVTIHPSQLHTPVFPWTIN